MHLTLKTEATKPAAPNVLQQQARFDAFVDALQPGAAASGARHEGARPTSTRAHRASIAASRSSTYPFHDHDHHRDPLRPDLLQAAGR